MKSPVIVAPCWRRQERAQIVLILSTAMLPFTSALSLATYRPFKLS